MLFRAAGPAMHNCAVFCSPNLVALLGAPAERRAVLSVRRRPAPSLLMLQRIGSAPRVAVAVEELIDHLVRRRPPAPSLISQMTRRCVAGPSARPAGLSARLVDALSAVGWARVLDISPDHRVLAIECALLERKVPVHIASTGQGYVVSSSPMAMATAAAQDPSPFAPAPALAHLAPHQSLDSLVRRIDSVCAWSRRVS